MASYWSQIEEQIRSRLKQVWNPRAINDKAYTYNIEASKMRGILNYIKPIIQSNCLLISLHFQTMKIGTNHGALNLNLDAPVVISVQWHQYDNMSFSVFDAHLTRSNGSKSHSYICKIEESILKKNEWT